MGAQFCGDYAAISTGITPAFSADGIRPYGSSYWKSAFPAKRKREGRSMYLHLGKNEIVPERSVIGIFDLDQVSWGWRGRE